MGRLTPGGDRNALLLNRLLVAKASSDGSIATVVFSVIEFLAHILPGKTVSKNGNQIDFHATKLTSFGKSSMLGGVLAV